MFNKNQISLLQKKDNLSSAIMGISSIVTLTAMPMVSFADNTELGAAITTLIGKIGTLLTTVFGPLCVLILAIAIITIIIGKNSKSAESGMEWAKRAVIGFIAFNLLGSILTYGISLFSQAGTQQWGTVTAALGLLGNV